MGTNTVHFCILLIFQVVLLARAAPSGPQDLWNEVTNNHAGDSERQFIIENKPMGNLRPIFLNQINPDDVNEMQIPPPPTQNTFAFGDRDTTEFTNSEAPAVYPGAGNLDTNEIVKGNDELTSQTSNSFDEKNAFDTQVTTGGGSYSFPELDAAVENAVNHLPSSKVSPLSPLIRIFSERVKESENNQNKSPREFNFDQSHNRVIILKLANKALTQSDLFGSPNIPEPVVQEHQEEVGNSNPNETSEDNEPCDCEGGCLQVIRRDQANTNSFGGGEEIPQVQAELEPSTRDDASYVQGQVEHPRSSGSDTQPEDTQPNIVHPKLVAHIVVRIRNSKPKDANTLNNIQLMPSPLSLNSPMQPLQRLENPFSEVFPRIINAHNSFNIVPQPADFENNNQARNPNEVDDSAIAGLVKNLGGAGLGESSERPFSFTAGQDPSHLLVQQEQTAHHRALPKELILLKLIHTIIKQKALANAITETRPFPSPLPAGLGVVVVGHRPELPSSPLPPLHFPYDVSDDKVIPADSFHMMPTPEELQAQEPSEERGQIFAPETTENTSDSGSQEVPWFIKNIIASISRQGGLQPIPGSPTQAANAPGMLKAVLSPYTITG